jgi:hypothetical protein
MAKKNLIVGLFVLAALALFTVGLFLIGNRHEAFSRHMDFYTEFTDLAGLTKGTKVQVAGMDAGQIIEIDVPDSPEGPDAILRGEFVVKDPASFAAVLTNGVGRHRAYGYGMLLLRPAQMD